MTKLVSVLLPTLNERGNIVPLIRRIQKVFDPLEIIVVDDNSPDGTVSRIESARITQGNVHPVKNDLPIGLTRSIQKGINLAKGKYVAWMDADFSHPPELLSIMYKRLLDEKADVAVGSWLAKGGKDRRTEFFSVLYSYSINRLCQICFGSHVHTYTSGYILTKKSLIKKVPLRGNYGEYCIDFLVRCVRSHKTIVEVPFECVSRQKGRSKTAGSALGYLVKGRHYIGTIVRLLIEGK